MTPNLSLRDSGSGEDVTNISSPAYAWALLRRKLDMGWPKGRGPITAITSRSRTKKSRTSVREYCEGRAFTTELTNILFKRARKQVIGEAMGNNECHKGRNEKSHINTVNESN